ncbi:unnamed protein product, partial [Mesorhabditis belari]|uniref:non-specific serine/threonine protein kinase n=1 Tax=Mesorhabditis belari TaxID=2138241 RepID=A0AAF3J9Z8_9BILA
MMVARLKADEREVKSEPATFDNDSEASDSSVECELPARFQPSHHPHPIPSTQRVVAEDALSRTISAQSLPVGTSRSISDGAQLSLYERTIHMLAEDPMYQKEVALGKRIGFYRLGKELGAGNFSKVKMGIHVLTKEKVAVKVMEKTKMDQKQQRLLAREILTMEKMNHPHIVRLFECVETLTRMHLVMEYAGGGELYAYVHDKGKLTEQDAKPLFAQIVSAVHHMHSREVVHRDIKAENVMFSAPGHVKLVDFGFSCHIAGSTELATFCGSPPYAAPELYRDKSYNGTMVDIWALGVLLYFMLVGITPFKGETVAELKEVIIAGTYSMPEYLSTFAQHMISKMLEMDPGKRMDIHDVKKAYWLRDIKFPRSYLSFPTLPSKEELDCNETQQRVWEIMNRFGITEEMLADTTGPRNSIVGTYRIVLYQVQAEKKEAIRKLKAAEELEAVGGNHLMRSSGKKRRPHSGNPPMLKDRSKTCAIL